MRPAVVARAALSVALTTAASPSTPATNNFCTTLKGLVHTLEQNPDGLKGRPDPELTTADHQVWKASSLLPNAAECSISGDKSDSSVNLEYSYSCRWLVDTPKKGLSIYREFASGARTCFSGARTEDSASELNIGVTDEGGRQTDLVIEWERRSLEISLRIYAWRGKQ
jgi:hypothetical protein